MKQTIKRRERNSRLIMKLFHSYFFLVKQNFRFLFSMGLSTGVNNFLLLLFLFSVHLFSVAFIGFGFGRRLGGRRSLWLRFRFVQDRIERRFERLR